MNTFEWLEVSALADWVNGSLWGYPIMLVCHAIGLAVVVGILTMLNLRILGLFRGLSFASFNPLIKLAWVGFVVNFASGCALFVGQATVFVESTPFLIKISAIFLAGINAAFLQNLLKQNALRWDTGEALAESGRLFAISSLILWSIAVIAGRMIAYLDVG